MCFQTMETSSGGPSLCTPHGPRQGLGKTEFLDPHKRQVPELQVQRPLIRAPVLISGLTHHYIECHQPLECPLLSISLGVTVSHAF